MIAECAARAPDAMGPAARDGLYVPPRRTAHPRRTGFDEFRRSSPAENAAATQGGRIPCGLAVSVVFNMAAWLLPLTGWY